MNRLARKIVLFGAVIIAILLIVLYFASRKMLQEVESRLNQGMEFARIQVKEAQSSQYGIQSFDYTPFKCSGLMDYKCKSEKITIYMDDFTTSHHDIHESIRLHNFTLSSEDIKSKNHLSFKVKTDIEYPTMNKFFGDSTKEPLIAFFNHSADSLLPNKLECEQDYLYKTGEGTSHTITANTQCNLISQMFSTNIESVNVFTPNAERTHIIGILYDIAMAMNGDSNKEELQAQNIPHELLSLKFNIQPKQSFKDFLAANDKLTSEQKKTLETQFEANLSLMKLIGTPFLASYIGTNSQTLIQGVSDIMQNKSKELDIQLTLKNPPNFQPLKVFKSMSVTDWLSYFNKNYDIVVNTKE
ncbi:MAG: hypothetical protein SPJ83_09815 [Helicobacter sp.]|uniref:hypothetical protein n=1 Tax=Helicobacter sp. TaxID=218 RepID=UPI002A90B306|nr:hypothetical protein [Helicobacter sp.]MDY5823061.1 hypothetical protein [Helicobacter sp.]